MTCLQCSHGTADGSVGTMLLLHNGVYIAHFVLINEVWKYPCVTDAHLFFIMCDKNVGPQLRLGLGEDVNDNGLPFEVSVIKDALHSFQHFHGTGTSFVHFCTVHLLRHVRRNNAGVEKTDLQNAVHTMYNAYEHCCKALQLKYPLHHAVSDHVLENTAGVCINIESGVEDLDQSAEIAEDDMSWFFDGPDNSTDNDNADKEVLSLQELEFIAQLARGNISPQSSSDSEYETPKIECTAPATGITNRSGPITNTFSHDWLLAGLQHCVPHDYAMQTSSSTTNAIALPMQLAGAVKLHLWDCNSNQHTKPHSSRSSVDAGITIDSFDVANLIDEMSTAEGSLKHSLHKHLHVRTVTGLPVSRCCALPGALILGCRSRDYETLCTICAAKVSHETQQAGSNVQTATFHRTVVVGANLGMLGEQFNEQNSALGNSQQARAIQYTSTVTAEAYIQSLRANVLHEQSSYVHQVCAVLVQHRVDLLLCHAGMMTTNLVDCLAAHGIAVLPVQTEQELNSAADLTGAEVIDDIIALNHCDIGCRSVCIRHILDLPSMEAKYKPPSVSRSGLSSSDGGDQAELCIGGFREDPNGVLQVGDDQGEQQCLVALCAAPVSESATATATETATATATLNHNTTADTPVSVVICAPTHIMTQVIADRFHRCLHRLRAVVEDGGAVIPSAGVLEIVCILRLDEVAAGLDPHCGQVEVIRLFQQVLVEYMCTIMLNSGCSYLHSFEQVNNTLCALRELVGATNSAASDTLAFVSALSNEEKLALPQPVRPEDAPIGEQVLVLDAVRVKLAGLQSALLAVCELASVRTINIAKV